MHRRTFRCAECEWHGILATLRLCDYLRASSSARPFHCWSTLLEMDFRFTCLKISSISSFSDRMLTGAELVRVNMSPTVLSTEFFSEFLCARARLCQQIDGTLKMQIL